MSDVQPLAFQFLEVVKAWTSTYYQGVLVLDSWFDYRQKYNQRKSTAETAEKDPSYTLSFNEGYQCGHERAWRRQLICNSCSDWAWATLTLIKL